MPAAGAASIHRSHICLKRPKSLLNNRVSLISGWCAYWISARIATTSQLDEDAYLIWKGLVGSLGTTRAHGGLRSSVRCCANSFGSCNRLCAAQLKTKTQYNLDRPLGAALS